MILKLNSSPLIVFDLDDTLYHEIDFVKSAFLEIASLIDPDKSNELVSKMLDKFHTKENVFEWILKTFPNPLFDLPSLLKIYHDHKPTIFLRNGVKKVLDELISNNAILILVTDGRSISQRNKIASLQISTYFDEIFISSEINHEKKDGFVFNLINEMYPLHQKVMFGDNPSKDFEWPNKLNWITIGLKDNGQNIHSQVSQTNIGHPQHYIDTFVDLVIKYE